MLLFPSDRQIARRTPAVPFQLGRYCWWYPDWADGPILEAVWDFVHPVALNIAALWGHAGLRGYILGRAWAGYHRP